MPYRKAKNKTMKKEIPIPDPVFMKAVFHAKERYPEECCGILAGKRSSEGECRILDYIRTENDSFSESKHGDFRIDPLKLYELEKDLEEKGLEILGFVHSHPDAPAVLSKEDIKYMIPNLLYLILEISEGEVRDFGLFEQEFDRK